MSEVENTKYIQTESWLQNTTAAQPFYHISNVSRQVGPVYGSLALGLQQFVALREMPAAQESPVGGERTGVDTGQDVVLLLVHLLPLLLGVAAPQEEDDPTEVPGDPPDDGVGQFLPAAVLVRVCLGLPDSEHSVQQENSLASPASQVAVVGSGEAGDVVGQLLVDVDQTRRWSHPGLHRETEAVGLAWPVVGVLAQDDHLDVLYWSHPGPGPDLATTGVDHSPGLSLSSHELTQSSEPVLAQRVLQGREPGQAQVGRDQREVLGEEQQLGPGLALSTLLLLLRAQTDRDLLQAGLSLLLLLLNLSLPLAGRGDGVGLQGTVLLLRLLIFLGKENICEMCS